MLFYENVLAYPCRSNLFIIGEISLKCIIMLKSCLIRDSKTVLLHLYIIIYSRIQNTSIKVNGWNHYLNGINAHHRHCAPQAVNIDRQWCMYYQSPVNFWQMPGWPISRYFVKHNRIGAMKLNLRKKNRQYLMDRKQLGSWPLWFRGSTIMEWSVANSRSTGKQKELQNNSLITLLVNTI